MNLFIDTNIYLTFYHYTSDDLEELKKLAVAIESGEIKLYTTQQVIEEFRRNREAKIADALKKFIAQKLNDQFPQICKEYEEEFLLLGNSIRKYEESKNKILEKLNEDIESKNLGADKIIDDLFNKVEVLKYSDEILSSAKIRMDLGNPPGKKGSYGDAINWESLITNAPNEDFYLITDDKDYISPIDKNRLDRFLLEEWEGKKESQIFFYRKLSDFFRDKFPNIKLASELEKELAVFNLIKSGNFKETHKAITHLSKFTDFTDVQINDIVNAAISNNQIYLINEDKDVKRFLDGMVNDKEHVIDPEKLEVYNKIYKSRRNDEGEEIGVEEITF